MAVKANRVALAVAARALLSLPEGDRTGGQNVWVRNLSATNEAHIGGADVTSADGFVVPTGATIGPIVVEAGEELHGISALGATLAVLRTGL